MGSGGTGKKDLDRRYAKVLFERSENAKLHNPFSWSMEIYEAVWNSDWERLHALLYSAHSWSPGVLADDPIRSLKNACICLISFMDYRMIERAPEMNELVFSFSDACIQTIESGTTHEEILDGLYNSLMSFPTHLQEDKQKSYHYLVHKAQEYIYAHMHEELHVADIAEALHVSPSYLSRSFSKATGKTLKDFLTEEKIYRARNLLLNSDVEIAAVSRYLGFSSQSHFTKTFREQVGMTPKAFRQKYT